MAEEIEQTAAETDDVSGVQTGSDRTPAPATFDRDALEKKIAGKFASVFQDEDDLDEEPAEEKEPADKSGTEEDPGEEQAAQEAAAEEKDGDAPAVTPTTESTKAEAAADKAPTLPAAYRRSLKAYEWTDEEIDANLKALGPKFIETAEKLHRNRNKEVQEWAEAGRQARQQSTPPKDEATAEKKQPATQTAPAGLKPIDAAELKAKYGDEALIDALVGPVNAAIEQITRIAPVIQQSQQKAQMAELETLGRQIDGFFGGKDMDSYKDMYGASNAALTDPQVQARNKVLELADALVGGARLQRRNLSFDEAMQLAHDSVTSGVKEKVARTAIAKQLQTRTKGITLRPGSRTATPAGGTKDRGQLEKRVAAGLKSVFG